MIWAEGDVIGSGFGPPSCIDELTSCRSIYSNGGYTCSSWTRTRGALLEDTPHGRVALFVCAKEYTCISHRN